MLVLNSVKFTAGRHLLLKTSPLIFKLNMSSSNVVNLAYDLSDKHNSPKALVIAHGLFASKASWKSVAKRLNEVTKQKIYTVDMRNHADSLPYQDSMNYFDMANDLETFIREIVIEKDKCTSVSLLGHSMGGKTAMTLVLKNKDETNLIDKLIVSDIAPSTSPSLNSIKTYLEKMISIDMSSFAGMSFFKARKQIEDKLCELESLKNDNAQLQFLLSRLTESEGKIKWNFNLPSIINHIHEIMEFPEFNSKFSRPTLFMGGERSNYITDKELPAIKNYFPNVKLIKVPRAGHVIHYDNPHDTIKVIHEFIDK